MINPISNCLVTIITISKNNAKSLCKTLESVKHQKYPEIEHIIIDGDSSDGSKELLESYSHSKLYSYFSEPDNGISSAFNKGLDKSTGNLILFLNSGDVLVNDLIISDVVESYVKYQWKFAVGSVAILDKTGVELIYSPPRFSSKFLKFLMFLPHTSAFCETSLHKKYRFDESIKTSMDYDLFLQMHPIEIFYLPILVSKLEPGGVSSQTDKRVIEQSQIRSRYATRIHERVIISIVNFIILFKSYLKIDSPFTTKSKKY